MANLAIKGHATRGGEVIEILEMLGGKNSLKLNGNDIDAIYYISSEGYINASYDKYTISNYNCFTLEEFEEEYPYRVGDKVTLDNKLCSIIWMYWECNNIYYTVQSQGTGVMYTKKVTANELKPRKEQEDMTKNKLIDLLPVSSDKILIAIRDGFEIIEEDGKFFLQEKKTVYPKTYEECCEVFDIHPSRELQLSFFTDISEIEKDLFYKLSLLYKLYICRNAYWKIAGEEMGLDKPWEPNFGNCNIPYYCIFINNIGDIAKECFHGSRYTLTFPTPEMRDTFYGNFKDLIERCKELL